MYRSFIRRNITSVAVIIFVVIFCSIQIIAPHFLYNKDGSLRQFGIGYKKKTVIPNWLVALILSILSYLFVLYYLTAAGVGNLGIVDCDNLELSNLNRQIIHRENSLNKDKAITNFFF